jgi:AcrR family transcriptional regulator
MATSTARRARGSGTPPLADIVTAALAFIDTHGLDRFSINALAADMGAIQPNMYRRISGRRELLDLVVDQIMTEAGLPVLDPSDWHAWLADWGVRVRRAWHAHPGASGLIHHGSTQSIAAIEAVLGVFLEAFPPEFVVVGSQAYLAHVFGATLLETRAAAGDEPDRTFPQELSAETLPNLAEYARIVAVRGTSAQSAEQSFVAGLTILLDGLRTHTKPLPGQATRRQQDQVSGWRRPGPA